MNPWICVIFFILTEITFSTPKVREVASQLRFLYDKPASTPGVQVVGRASAKVHPASGEFHLKLPAGFQKVTFKPGRRTPAIAYNGPQVITFFRSKVENTITTYEPCGSVRIPDSPECLILFSISGSPANPAFAGYAIPHGGKSLARNSILFCNQSTKELALIIDGNPRLKLRAKTYGAIPLPSPDSSAIHLELRSLSQTGVMKLEYSREYAFVKNSKHACIFYQTQPDSALQTKFLSGLDH